MKIIIDTSKDSYAEWKYAETLIEEMYQIYRRRRNDPVPISPDTTE